MFHLECIIMYIINISAFKLQKKTKKRKSLSSEILLIPFILIYFFYRRYLSHAFFLIVISLAVFLAQHCQLLIFFLGSLLSSLIQPLLRLRSFSFIILSNSLANPSISLIGGYFQCVYYQPIPSLTLQVRYPFIYPLHSFPFCLHPCFQKCPYVFRNFKLFFD